NRRIPGFEDAEIAGIELEFREFRFDGHRRQPLGDINQFDQALDRNPCVLDLAPERLGSRGFRLSVRLQRPGLFVRLPTVFGGAPRRVPPLGLLELTTILLFPLVAVLVRYKAGSVPKRAGGRLDRLFSHRPQIHGDGPCWSIQVLDGSTTGLSKVSTDAANK